MDIKNRMVLSCGLMACLLLTANCNADSDQKQSLSEVLKATIKSDGPAAAQQRFNDLYPAHKEDYIIDSQSLMQLVSEYANNGNMEAVQALGEIISTVTQDMMQEQMAQHPELQRQIEQQKALKKTKQKQQATVSSQTKPVETKTFEPRDDLGRFTGLYGNANKPDPYRQFWVSQSCEGQLVMGATWGDAAPWRLLSESDTGFSYTDSFMSLGVEFKLNSANQATELSHDLKGMASPLVRVGPLTDDYADCLKPLRH